ncbi:hypothetical protein D8B34_21965 [Verminephrobacter eiseniae]|nr:hypothetical protein [Verminephrobacter eiseniae]MCW5293429.1 hypothetical protein [Verminephrobacter eiseniae]MCW8186932.1 hypothetical protein [Verminephrobacter eiseniae]MCW8225301.1 hypothetical protein [Verminephrobacter eiseniae]MCW8236292.1 hypothetical protein [Verminephrobacter eiseniae]
MALAPSIGPVGGVCLFVYIVVTGPRQGRRDEPRIETRSVEDTASDGGHMARSAMCSTSAILFTPFGHGTNLDGSSPVSSRKQKELLVAMC